MYSSSKWFPGTCLWLFALLICGWLVAQVGGGVFHPIDSRCSECHLADPQKYPKKAYQLLASQEALCSKCHAGAIKVSHPSGLQPERDLPTEFPVDWKGDMTCSTCHNVHRSGAGIMRVADSGKDLCLRCHDKAFFQAMRDGGSSIMQLGHVEASADLSPIELDPFSLQCMECHADRAGIKEIKIDYSGVLRHASNAMNHPIGVRYSNYVGFGGYKALESLNEWVLLPDGKVACVSCHKGYSQIHGGLVSNYADGSLCKECHQL